VRRDGRIAATHEEPLLAEPLQVEVEELRVERDPAIVRRLLPAAFKPLTWRGSS
jgi:hypothetical protein